MLPERETYAVEVAGVKRNLPLFEVAPGLRIAVLNILGDTELVKACAVALAQRLADTEYDALVTAEAKSIPLVHALAQETGKDYVVLRKSYKLYMGETLSAETVSITTRQPQTLYLDEKDRAMLQGKRVVLLDDVVSTGLDPEGDAQSHAAGRGAGGRRGGRIHRRGARGLARDPGARSSPTVQERLNRRSAQS